MNQQLLQEVQRQNRLLKGMLGVAGIGLVALLTMAAKKDDRATFSEINVERINVLNADGGQAIVIANRERLPQEFKVDGKTMTSNRGEKPGMIFYNGRGDEVGGLIFDGKLDDKGKPASGMHFSMDRFGGDQQVSLSHIENNGSMETGLKVYDRGLVSDYAPLQEAMDKAPPGPEKDALRQKWKEAGGAQTSRVFVGRTRGKSSAVILADAQGRPKIMMLVSPDGKPALNFLDDQGNVTQSFPQEAATK